MPNYKPYDYNQSSMIVISYQDQLQKADDDRGWFGSERLATMIPRNGHWQGMGAKRNFRDKSWWWYKGYKAASGTANKLGITARNLSSGQEVVVFPASDAYEGSHNYSWDSMSTAFEFPEEGCWQVIGIYENEKLIFNLWVGEQLGVHQEKGD